jgi:hypothetical protein
MDSKSRPISLGFSPEYVAAGQHICYIFNDESERSEVIARYVEAGLAAGEKLLYLVDAMTPAELLESLASMGVDLSSHPERLTVADSAKAYCPTGSFNADASLTSLNAFCVKALEDGYPGVRITGELPWGRAESRISPEELMTYEARVTDLMVENSYTACCQYDARRVDGETIMDMLSVHPLMIVRGRLVKNPYFVPPAVFLKEYLERKSSRAGS